MRSVILCSGSTQNKAGSTTINISIATPTLVANCTSKVYCPFNYTQVLTHLVKLQFQRIQQITDWKPTYVNTRNVIDNRIYVIIMI